MERLAAGTAAKATSAFYAATLAPMRLETDAEALAIGRERARPVGPVAHRAAEVADRNVMIE